MKTDPIPGGSRKSSSNSKLAKLRPQERDRYKLGRDLGSQGDTDKTVLGRSNSKSKNGGGDR